MTTPLTSPMTRRLAAVSRAGAAVIALARVCDQDAIPVFSDSASTTPLLVVTYAAPLPRTGAETAPPMDVDHTKWPVDIEMASNVPSLAPTMTSPTVGSTAGEPSIACPDGRFQDHNGAPVWMSM